MISVGLVKRRETWVLTWRGRVLLLAVIVNSLMLIGRQIHPFWLSVPPSMVIPWLLKAGCRVPRGSSGVRSGVDDLVTYLYACFLFSPRDQAQA